MSRSILLPLLALGGIILYGTTKAARPATDFAPPDDGPDRIEMTESTPPTRRAPPAPPPAPGLRSDEAPEVEEDTSSPTDSTASEPVGEGEEEADVQRF